MTLSVRGSRVKLALFNVKFDSSERVSTVSYAFEANVLGRGVSVDFHHAGYERGTRLGRLPSGGLKGVNESESCSCARAYAKSYY